MSGEVKQMRVSKKRARIDEEPDFKYECEWQDCTFTTTTMSLFNKHVNNHRLVYLRQICQEEKRSTLEGMFTARIISISHFMFYWQLPRG